jgi:hypothetical protein
MDAAHDESQRSVGYAAASVFVPASGCGLLASVALGLPLMPAGGFLAGAGILAVSGLLTGLLLGAAQLALSWFPWKTGALVWLLAGLAGGAWVIARLEAFSKLGAAHAGLAMTTIALGVSGGLAVGALLAALQPSASGRPPVARLSARSRGTLAFALFAAAMAAIVLDEATPLLSVYPAARTALLVAGALCGWSSLASIALSFVRTPRRLAVCALACSIGTLLLGMRGALAQDREYVALAGSGPGELALGFLRRLTDRDHDGASGFFGGGDCAPSDPKIHPRAREIAGNGVDDNCRYGDAPKRERVVLPPRASSAAAPDLDIVLITIDSLRADHTSIHGYTRNTTPNLANLARASRVFENAYTTGGWTGLAVPSMLAGVLPRRLEWQQALEPIRSEGNPNDLFARDTHVVLSSPRDDGRWTLPGALRMVGYRTIASLSRGIGFYFPVLKSGFDVAEFTTSPHDDAVTELALERFREAQGKRVFLWVHYYAPHAPQDRYEGVPVFGESLLDRYDHEIAFTDREVGRLLSGLSSARTRPMAIVVAADHGEVLAENQTWHGGDLYEGSIRIPLLLKAPGLEPKRVKTPASLLDVAPTLLGILGASAPSGLDGADLRFLEGDRVVLTDLWRYSRSELYLDQVAASNADYHLTFDRLQNTIALHAARDAAMVPVSLPGPPPPALMNTLGAYLESASGGP